MEEEHQLHEEGIDIERQQAGDHALHEYEQLVLHAAKESHADEQSQCGNYGCDVQCQGPASQAQVLGEVNVCTPRQRGHHAFAEAIVGDGLSVLPEELPYRLVGKHTFCGVYKGSENNYKLWQEVQDYISANYDLDFLERVYISGDGAPWIKAGAEIIVNSRFVLDKFHMMKYLDRSVSHLEGEDEMKEYIWKCLNEARKEDLKDIYKDILRVTKEGKPEKYDDVKETLQYFLNNWDGIVVRYDESGRVWKCCAEGQVSHVLSDRVSSRPMGWSTLGCDNISKLRAYTRNGGKIIDLLRYQEKHQALEAKRREQDELIADIKRRQNGWDYADVLNTHVLGTEKPNMRWLRDIIDQKLA